MKIKRPPKELVDELHAVLQKHKWTGKKYLSPKGLASALSTAAASNPSENCRWVLQPDGTRILVCD
jgi:hypothetical protein